MTMNIASRISGEKTLFPYGFEIDYYPLRGVYIPIQSNFIPPSLSNFVPQILLVLAPLYINYIKLWGE